MARINAVLAVDTERQEETCCPVEIAHLQEFEFLRIIWDDGHRSEYSLAHLRSYCSCPLCKGHGDYSRFERKDSLMPMITTIGDAALRIAWGNGDHTSIYEFTLLRSLCSCHVCQASKTLGGLNEGLGLPAKINRRGMMTGFVKVAKTDEIVLGQGKIIEVDGKKIASLM